MRVTSDLWVSALLRRVQAEGGFAAVVRRGATEAGAVFLLLRSRTGELSLFGPAPQTGYDESRPTDRYFSSLISGGTEDVVEAKLERALKLDPGIWVVELEINTEQLSQLVEIMTL